MTHGYIPPFTLAFPTLLTRLFFTACTVIKVGYKMVKPIYVNLNAIKKYLVKCPAMRIPVIEELFDLGDHGRSNPLRRSPQLFWQALERSCIANRHIPGSFVHYNNIHPCTCIASGTGSLTCFGMGWQITISHQLIMCCQYSPFVSRLFHLESFLDHHRRPPPYHPHLPNQSQPLHEVMK